VKLLTFEDGVKENFRFSFWSNMVKKLDEPPESRKNA
jgi:hypothetical protein